VIDWLSVGIWLVGALVAVLVWSAERAVARLDRLDREMNRLKERMAVIETCCQIRHPLESGDDD
jgi:hypothetical protein